jgi:hypothetical protein
MKKEKKVTFTPLSANAKQLAKIRQLQQEKTRLQLEIKDLNSMLGCERLASDREEVFARQAKQVAQREMIVLLSNEIADANLLADLTGFTRFIGFADRLRIIQQRLTTPFNDGPVPTQASFADNPSKVSVSLKVARGAGLEVK